MKNDGFLFNPGLIGRRTHTSTGEFSEGTSVALEPNQYNRSIPIDFIQPIVECHLSHRSDIAKTAHRIIDYEYQWKIINCYVDAWQIDDRLLYEAFRFVYFLVLY